MSGKPLTNIINGKTGDSQGLRASGATLCRRGWESRAGRAGVQRGAPGPGWPAQTLLGHVPARRLQANEASAPPRHSGGEDSLLGGLLGQAHGPVRYMRARTPAITVTVILSACNTALIHPKNTHRPAHTCVHTPVPPTLRRPTKSTTETTTPKSYSGGGALRHGF